MTELQIGHSYKGKNFNKMVNKLLYRITYKSEIHNRFEYKSGLNIDTEHFNPSGECQPGGLYFFDGSQVVNYKKYLSLREDGYWIRQVEIPDDARVYVETGKYKADRFILRGRMPIADILPDKLCDVYAKCIDSLIQIYGTDSSKFNEECPIVLKFNEDSPIVLKFNESPIIFNYSLLPNITMYYDPYFLEYVNEQTEKLCLKVVKQNSYALRFVKNQTENICINAVKRKGMALQYVNEQTEAICIEAVRQNVRALYYVKDQTEAICIEAVNKKGYALEYVKDQTEMICIEAVKKDGYALRYVKDQTEMICIEAVKKAGGALVHVKDQTEMICIEAVKENGYAIKHVKKQTEAICMEAVKRDGRNLQYVKQTEAICVAAIKENWRARKYVDEKYKYLLVDSKKFYFYFPNQ